MKLKEPLSPWKYWRLRLTLFACSTTHPWLMTFEGDFEQIGIGISQIMDLSEFESKLLNRILRSGEISIDQAVTFMEVSQDLVREELKKLADKGFIIETQDGAKTVFRPLLKARGTRGLPEQIWRRLRERNIF